VDVTIEIGELDLADVPAGRRSAVAAAFERELARLVTLQPPAARPPVTWPRTTRPPDRSAPAAQGVQVGARPDGDPVVFGVALARAVHRSLR
jgi:hypothetical protein